MSRDAQDREAGCIGKARFTTWTSAARVARLRAKGRQRKAGEPYACRFCAGFHIGASYLGKGKWHG